MASEASVCIIIYGKIVVVLTTNCVIWHIEGLYKQEGVSHSFLEVT